MALPFVRNGAIKSKERNGGTGTKLRTFKPEQKDGAGANELRMFSNERRDGFEVNKFRVGHHTVRAAQEMHKGKFTVPQDDNKTNKFRVAQHVIRGAQHLAGSGFFVPNLPNTDTTMLFEFNRRLLMGSEFRFQLPPPLDQKILKIMDRFYDDRPLTLEYTYHKDQSKQRYVP